MKLFNAFRMAVLATAACTALSSPENVQAFEFNTLVFSEDFEGFDDGHTVSAGSNEAPSTGLGLLWQYIGTPGQEVEVTSAQSFGEGSQSLDYVRPFIGIVPRYFTYPNPVPEANATANSEFGFQYDIYMAPNEFVTDEESPYFGLSGVNMNLAPGGSPTNSGAIISNGDGEIQAWDTVLQGWQRTGYFFGEGWQTMEMSVAVGASLGTTADAVITHYLTRHDGNSAEVLERTQIYQTTENLLLDANFRLDINNNQPGRFYLDNILFGTLGASTSLVGDYNDDGTVDAADYTVWRNNFGTEATLPNDPIGGTIGSFQYDQWKSNFGMGGGVGATALGGANVPEPSACVLVLVGLTGMLTLRKRL